MVYFIFTILSIILSFVLSPFVLIVWFVYAPYRTILYLKSKKICKQLENDDFEEVE